MFVRRLLAWGRRHRRDFPWRTESDPFRVLVAEVLLQRSRGRTVAGVYNELFRRWPSAERLGAAPEAEIRSVIRPLGLVGRARNLKALACCVQELGDVPRDADRLIALPGVGRYAAHATIVAAFNKAAPVVDGVTARVYRRYFGLSADTPAVSDDALWDVVAEVSPKSASRDWNWAVLDLASAICMPKVPRCGDCPVREGCAFARESVGADC